MSFLDDAPGDYVSILSAFDGLPPLDLCLEEAFLLENSEESSAYSKAKDFFLEISGSDINLPFDASYLLSQQTLKIRSFDPDVLEILTRIATQKTNSIIRSGENDAFIRRRSSKGEDYHLASALDCDCDYKRHVRNPNKLCVHMAIMRVIEATFMRMTKDKVNGEDNE